jgi:hypothetical protein
MQIEDSSIIALGMAGLGAAWGGIVAFFSIKNKLEVHDVRLQAHNEKMEEIEAHMEDSHRELKDAMTRSEGKLDRLIERFIPQQSNRNGN